MAVRMTLLDLQANRAMSCMEESKQEDDSIDSKEENKLEISAQMDFIRTTSEVDKDESEQLHLSADSGTGSNGTSSTE